MNGADGINPVGPGRWKIKVAMLQRKKLTLRQKDARFAYLVFSPAFALLIAFLIWPTLRVFLLSFTDSNLLRPKANKQFNWFKNYLWLFSNKEFLLTMFRSTIFTISATIISLVISYLIAVLIHVEFIGKGLVTALLFLPWVISDVVTAFVFKWNYDLMYGIINYFLFDLLHILSEPIAWLGNRYSSFPSVIIANIWRLLPFSTLTIIAALQQVPQEIIDSAKVDGSGPIRMHLKIIIPYLKAPLTILLTLRIGALFRSFDIIWLLTKGGPGYSTTTLPVMYYKTAFEAMDIGQGAAIAVHIFLFVFLVYLFIYRTLGKDAFN